MAKRTTLKEIGEMLEHVVKHMATKDDVEDIRQKMATKDQLFALQTQVNAIETNIRDMKHTKLHVRVAELEEKVFGAARD